MNNGTNCPDGDFAAPGGINRRTMLHSAAAGALAASALSAWTPAAARAASPRKGNIRHSVCRWCFGEMSVEELAQVCQRLGIEGIDLIGPGDWPVLKEYGLTGTMTPSHGIGKGFNRIENHEDCIQAVTRSIEATAEAGFPNVICFSGNRAGMSDEEGLENCAIGLKKVVGLAEEKKIVIHMELLNSKDHADYMCDKSAWGVELVKRVGSPNFKLLYDIYHMQRMEGDVIHTIRENIDCFGHFHTAGVPGRNEIDETQELNYPAIMKAIVATGFKGIVAQEFVPKRDDQVASLEQAIAICDV